MSMSRCVAILAFLLVFSGCSLLFVDAPPQVRPGGEVPTSAVCTSSMALPTFDLVVGGLNALGGLALISGEYSTDEDVGLGWASIGLGTLQLISGSTGRGRVNRCREFLQTPVEPMGPPMPVELFPDTEQTVWSTDEGWTNQERLRARKFAPR